LFAEGVLSNDGDVDMEADPSEVGGVGVVPVATSQILRRIYLTQPFERIIKRVVRTQGARQVSRKVPETAKMMFFGTNKTTKP
jgi:hypothetical protein